MNSTLEKYFRGSPQGLLERLQGVEEEGKEGGKI